MTEGMPARTSIALRKKLEIAPSLKYSPRNSEIAMEKGIAMKMARKDVTSVPTRKGRAPKDPAVAFHDVLMKKVRPNFCIAGTAFMKSVNKMAISSTTIKAPEAVRIREKRFSDRSTLAGPLMLSMFTKLFRTFSYLRLR
jgi:hypothetical protein